MRYPRVRKPWLKWDETSLRRNVGLYVHIPFCLSRCGYCDFLTYGRERPAGLEPDAYSAKLTDEIVRRGAWARKTYAEAGRVVDTVFFGGGTPTYLKPELLAGLIQAARESFPLGTDAEITVEANPDTLDAAYLETLAAAGVNRLSIGIQATQTKHLRLLNRTHRWDDIQPALSALRNCAIRRWSFDVIYSLPGLRQRELRETLNRLLAVRPEHISAYELTLEHGTPLHRCALHLPRLQPIERETVRQQRLIDRVLAQAGLYRYEVSNYSRPGAECRHNLRYWRGGDYLGLGLGAASRIGRQVINNPRGWREYEQEVRQVGGVEDKLLKTYAELSKDSRELAPPADTFLQARTRLGLTGKHIGINPHWFAIGWIKPGLGGWEITSRGLNFAEHLALELD